MFTKYLYVIFSSLLKINLAFYEKSIIGLFSSCLTKTSNRTEKEIQASTMQSMSRYLFTTDCIIPDMCTRRKGNFTVFYNYEEYDVCYDHNYLIEILLKLNLDQRYQTTKHIKVELTITLVVTYLSQPLSDIASVFLLRRSTRDPALITFDDGISFKYRQLFDAQIGFVSYQQIIKRGKYFNIVKEWNTIIVLLLRHTDKNEVYKQQYEDYMDLVKETNGLCYRTNIIDNREQFDASVQLLKKESRQTPIILFGPSRDQLELLHLAEGIRLRKIWFFHDVYISDSYSNYIMLNMAKTGLVFFINDIHSKYAIESYLKYKDSFKSWDELNNTNGCDDKCQGLYKDNFILLHDTKMSDALYNSKTYVSWRNLLLTRTEGVYSVISGFQRTFHTGSTTNNISTFMPNINYPSCPKPMCHPGRFKEFGGRSGSQWSYSHGWKCTQCPINTIKISYGNGQCIPCSSFLISNKQNTGCYDPYKKFHFSFQMTSIKTCVAFSICLCLSTLLIFAVIIQHRKTWIVQSTDLNVSSAHLTLLLINFILPNVSFVLTSNWIYWTAYLVSISLVNSCSLSIILVKSKKLLQAFNSKVLVTQNEAQRTKYHQISIIIFNMMLSIVVFILSFKIKALSEESIRHPSIFMVVEYCEHELQMILQIVFLVCLQIACFIPAYQGRNLPSVFNNAMVIVYVSFVMLISSLVFFPVYLFQNDPRDKLIVEHLIFQWLGLMQICFLYWPKLYVILIHPEKNTKEYLREKTLLSSMTRAKSLSMASSTST